MVAPAVAPVMAVVARVVAPATAAVVVATVAPAVVPATAAAVRRLSELAQQTARELGLAPEILATRREMERLVCGARDGDVLKGWRRAVIGERLLGAL